MQCKPRKGAQRRQSNETPAYHFNFICGGVMCLYITESMTYDKSKDNLVLVLIWKTNDNVFPHDAWRYRNNIRIAGLLVNQFTYTRRGEYLVGTISGSPSRYPEHWAGIGEWRIDPKIRGNVRGCV